MSLMSLQNDNLCVKLLEFIRSHMALETCYKVVYTILNMGENDGSHDRFLYLPNKL